MSVLKKPGAPSLSRWWSVESTCGSLLLALALPGALDVLFPKDLDLSWWPGEQHILREDGQDADSERVARKSRLQKTRAYVRSDEFVRNVVRGCFCAV